MYVPNIKQVYVFIWFIYYLHSILIHYVMLVAPCIIVLLFTSVCMALYIAGQLTVRSSRLPPSAHV